MSKNYKAERFTTILTVIMVLVLGYTMLTYFEIIETEDSYCRSPRDITCLDQSITYNKVQFNLEFQDSVKSLEVIPSSSGCQVFSKDSLSSKKIPVSISCDITASKGKKFKDTYQINYQLEAGISQKSFEITIKSPVE